MLYRFLDKYRIIVSIVLLAAAVASFFVLAPFFEKTDTYARQLSSLTDKENTLYGLTTASAVASAGIAAIPGDTTSAIADAITDLTLFFVISLGAVFLEKYLITVTGMVVFRILFPLACVLAILFLWSRSASWGAWAGKLAGFAVVILLAVPLSTRMADQMLEINRATIDSTVRVSGTETDRDEDKGILSGIENVIEGVIGGVTDTLEGAKDQLRRFVSSVAVMLVATCVMPLLAVVLVYLAARFFFGLRIEPFVRGYQKYRDEIRGHRSGLPDPDHHP